jgi:hypothetical protein
MPFTVKQNDWIAIVDKSMEGVRQKKEGCVVQVSRETDTTEMSELRNLWLKFLTHGQMRKKQPYMIKTGQVYHADGAYYFITEGLMDFLRMKKFALGRVNLREQLILYGCAESEVVYTNGKGIEMKVPCWKKPEDEELLAVDAYYEDIYEGDADILRGNHLNKEKKESNDGGDVRF